MIASWSLAVLSYLSLLVLMVVTKMSLEKQQITRPTAQRRFKLIIASGSLTGLAASLPIALALGGHSVASVLVREVSYATAIAMGVLCSTALLTRLVATHPTGSENLDHRQWDEFQHSISPTINPASGLPMNGPLDVAGNPYGSDSRSEEHHTWNP